MDFSQFEFTDRGITVPSSVDIFDAFRELHDLIAGNKIPVAKVIGFCIDDGDITSPSLDNNKITTCEHLLDISVNMEQLIYNIPTTFKSSVLTFKINGDGNVPGVDNSLSVPTRLSEDFTVFTPTINPNLTATVVVGIGTGYKNAKENQIVTTNGLMDLHNLSKSSYPNIYLPCPSYHSLLPIVRLMPYTPGSKFIPYRLSGSMKPEILKSMIMEVQV